MLLGITSLPLVPIMMRLTSTSALRLSASCTFLPDLWRFHAWLDRDHVRHATLLIPCPARLRLLMILRLDPALKLASPANRPAQRTEFHPAEPTSDPPDDRRSTGRYSTPPLLCMRMGCG